MAGRFEFESPGAAFTSAIAQELTSRKAEERQRLLDSLQFSAEQRADEQSRRQNELAQQQMAQSRQEMQLAKERGEREEVSALAANRRLGDNPEDFGYTPEQIGLFKKYGYIHDVPVPQVSTGSETFTDENGQPAQGPSEAPVVAPTPKTRMAFVGSQKEQEEEQLRRNSGLLISHMLQDPKQREAAMGLAQLAEANNGIIPADIYMQYAGPGKHLYSIGPQGQFKDTGQVVPPNSEVFHLPQDLRQRQWVPTRNVGPHGGQMLFDPESRQSVEIPGTANFGGAGGRNPYEHSLGIPNDAFQDHELYVGSLSNSADDKGKVTPDAALAFRASASRMIESSRATDPVKMAAKLYVQNPQAYAQLIASGRLQLSPAEVQQLDQLKHAVVPSQETEDILLVNPQRTFIKHPPAAPPKPVGMQPVPSHGTPAPGKTISQLMQDNQGMS